MPPGAPLPHRLRAAVAHAARLARVIERAATKVPHSSAAAAWLCGRSGELRVVTGIVVADWRRERIDASTAAARLGEHVSMLHRGLHERLGLRALPCCRPDDTTLDGDMRAQLLLVAGGRL